jgi:hypothetical protein
VKNDDTIWIADTGASNHMTTRNHLAEIGIHVIANRGRAMMENVMVSRPKQYILWREAFMTATKLDGLVLIEVDGKLKIVTNIGTERILDFLKI